MSFSVLFLQMPDDRLCNSLLNNELHKIVIHQMKKQDTSALEGITLPSDVPVSINTLENVLYMDLYNDTSFEIDGKLVVLIEH